MKKFLSWATLVVVVIWLFHNPAEGGHYIHQCVTDITAFASNL